MKIKIILTRLMFFLLFLLPYSILSAQTSPAKQWDKPFGGNNADNLYSLQQTTDGGYIAAGTSSSGISGDKTQNSKGNNDYWIIKVDADGNKQWDKTYGGSNDDFLYSVQQTTDGGYILGGYSNSNAGGDKSENGKGFNDYWIIKIDANGVKKWDKTFGGGDDDFLYSLEQTTDGGYILGGGSASSTGGDKSEDNKGGYDYWVIKINASGVKQWDKTLGGSQSEYFSTLQQTTDGGYILGGTSASNASGDKSENIKGSTDYWVIKIDANGVKQWDKTIGGSNLDGLHSLTQTTDGGYLLAGYSESDKSGDKSENSKGNYDYWVVKIDATGVKQWDKTYGGNNYDALSSLAKTADGYNLGGSSYSNIGGDKSENGKGISDYWIIKIDANGAKQWDKTFGGDDIEELTSLQQTADGNYILAGSSLSNTSSDKTENSRGDYDYWIVNLCANAATYYSDADGDGFGDAGNSIQACSQPQGYVTDNTDCNDADANIHLSQTFYADNDHDGFGDANNTTQACTQPQGYVANSTDCDDTKLLYADKDGDGFGAGSPVACGVANNSDCNDSDAAINPNTIWAIDNDHDGHTPDLYKQCTSRVRDGL